MRICLFRKKLCNLQSIHTELAKLYSKRVVSRMVCPANLWGGKFDPPRSLLSRQLGCADCRRRSGINPSDTTGFAEMESATCR